MPRTDTPVRHLTTSLHLGTPAVAGPLAVVPLFGPAPEMVYRALSQTVDHGMRITERQGSASVRDLVARNDGAVSVLLYEGEEVLGAQQNRTFDVSVLVAPGATVDLPVSCVEAGRWDGRRNHERFTPAPQSAYPALRHHKCLEARLRQAQGFEPRPDQGTVWNEVAAKSARFDAASDTAAMHDIYEHHRHTLSDLCAAIPLHAGQTGALVTIGGKVRVLDHVGRPEVFAVLHGPLVQGYALDALEAVDSKPHVDGPATRFVDALGAVRSDEQPTPGAGRLERLTGDGVVGSALVVEHDVVALTAFPATATV